MTTTDRGFAGRRSAPRTAPVSRERPSPTAARLICGRVWFVSAAHGEAERVESALHALTARIAEDDAIVFGGDLIGRGRDSRRCVDLALALRRSRMAQRPERGIDVVFLRGAQEEMLRKALQIQFAPDPASVMRWMLDAGFAATLEAYGASAADAVAAAAEGPLASARWANALRERIRTAPGHAHFYGALAPAATAAGLLFVHAGVAPERPLDAQGDAFWWSPPADLAAPYEDFTLVVRARDGARAGLKVGAYSAAVDDGCGYGGALLIACFTPAGRVVDMVEG